MFDLKKVISGAAIAVILPSMAVAMSSNAQGANAQNQGATFGSTTQSQTATETETQTRTQVQTNNPGTGTMTQTQAETQLRERVEECSPVYEPTSTQAQTRAGQITQVAKSVVELAEGMEDQTLAEEIRTVVRSQVANFDVINQKIDNAVNRTALAKFFIGPNYGELKVMKQTIEENKNQIREMEQVMAQIRNESEKIQLANQIITMQNLQFELQDQLGELTRGFSLFGWLNRWIRGY
jgi:hypothetical protein